VDQTELAEPVVHLPLSLPPAPAEPERPGFPMLAAVAPVAGAIALWAVTGSMYSLMFAALGPLVAVASVLDARRQVRRRRRRAELERAGLLASLEAEIHARHDEERRAAWRATPSAAALVERAVRPAWAGERPGPVVVGVGAVRSAVRVDGVVADARDRAVLEAAARLGGAPVVVDASQGIAFVGSPGLARAAARAALVSCAHHADPRTVELDLPDAPEWAWAARLPHAGDGGDRDRSVRHAVRVGAPASGRAAGPIRVVDQVADPEQAKRVGAPAAARIVIASDVGSLPPGLGAVVRLLGPGRARLETTTGAAPATIEPVLVSRAAARGWSESAAALAERIAGPQASLLPSRVALTELPAPAAGRRGVERASLAVAVGCTATGPLELDLVRHGPHALVGGTTGSGKSEFLLAWLTALARAYAPDEVSFLLVDFKGGAAFEPIRELPHVTGVVTDLDGAEARRAVESLRAELRHRESVLADAGARDVRELADAVDLPRLVIVVDEFQAMIEQFGELGAVVADIAGRGRSLGVHLVLASQRPNGVVRDQVTANCAIRVSLRVLQRADSDAVVGTPCAAEIPSDLPGRGVVDPGDGRPVPFQSAIATQGVIAAIAARSAALPRTRRTWLDPLPERIAPEAITELLGERRPADSPGREVAERAREGIGFGVIDEPEHQRRSLARWSTRRDGGLLVLGAPGSGRSTALSAIEWAAVEAAVASGPTLTTSTIDAAAPVTLRLDGPSSAVWDDLLAAQSAIRGAGMPPALVVIDDLDVRFRAWPEEYAHAAFAMVASLLREGRGRGVAVAASASNLLALGSGLREAFGSRLLLRHATRSDLVQSGGRGELWSASHGPGAGQWQGRRVQVVEAVKGSPPEARTVPVLELRPDLPYAIAARAPRAAAEEITAAGRTAIILVAGGEPAVRVALAAHPRDAPPPVIVGDAEAWSASWSLIAALREEAAVVVQGGTAEYRALVRSRELPPLLDEGTGQCWLIEPGRRARRAIWPERHDH
jgi:S-DNA-T family DNA segregation ATPase FtsK/SpoIIIE